MADVLPDSFEQPLSNKKTPSREVAINELTSAIAFCLLLGFFGAGCCLSGLLRGVFPAGCVAGFLSGFPENPSCVKYAILASCAGFLPVGNRGSKIAAVAKWTDSKWVRGTWLRNGADGWRHCGGQDTMVDSHEGNQYVRAGRTWPGNLVFRRSVYSKMRLPWTRAAYGCYSDNSAFHAVIVR
jgi:hypothetical protein